jgi:hypothetical protein
MSFPDNIEFPAKYMTYREFFDINNLFDEKYLEYKFILYGEKDYPVNLKLELENNTYRIIYINNDRVGREEEGEEGEEYENKDVSSKIFQQPTMFFGTRWRETISVSGWENCHIVKLIIIKPNNEKKEYRRNEIIGGRKASVKKEICGRMRCIYKIQGSRKEHIKYKGRLITVADYKKLMKKA